MAWQHFIQNVKITYHEDHKLYITIQYSPVADPSVLNTSIIISVADGLLRTSEGCTGPPFSLILDVKCVKFTVIANKPEK